MTSSSGSSRSNSFSRREDGSASSYRSTYRTPHQRHLPPPLSHNNSLGAYSVQPNTNHGFGESVELMNMSARQSSHQPSRSVDHYMHHAGVGQNGDITGQNSLLAERMSRRDRKLPPVPGSGCHRIPSVGAPPSRDGYMLASNSYPSEHPSPLMEEPVESHMENTGYVERDNSFLRAKMLAMGRQKSLIKPSRARPSVRRLIAKPNADRAGFISSIRDGEEGKSLHAGPKNASRQSQDRSNKCLRCWTCYTWCVTWWACPCCLRTKLFGSLKDSDRQHAFREKLALCSIIFVLCAALAFLTYGLPVAFCPPEAKAGRLLERDAVNVKNVPTPYSWILGDVYYTADVVGMFGQALELAGSALGANVPPGESVNASALVARRDLSSMFPPDSMGPCAGRLLSMPPPPCRRSGTCLSRSLLPLLTQRLTLAFEWDDVANSENGGPTLMVVNGMVLDMSGYLAGGQMWLGNRTHEVIETHLGTDATYALIQAGLFQDSGANDAGPPAKCLMDAYRIGWVSKETVGCFATNVILLTSLVVIVIVVMIRFWMAVAFDWFISHQLDKIRPSKPRPYYGAFGPPQVMHANDDMYVLLLVTCYSEGASSLRGTIDSLARTDYEDQRKLLFVIADGLITGSGNEKSTPDLLLDMIDLDPAFQEVDPEPLSYLAVSDGTRGHNMAKIYVGDYVIQPNVVDIPGRQVRRAVPMIIVVKCGTPEERVPGQAKPGNRGKRDSQIILMSFLQRVLFDERMTPLDYALFNNIYYLMGVTADAFEAVLMVDADTIVEERSLGRMVAALHRDPMVMGLCGETRIANKRESWVTTIQVFEYYISHHLGKAFESVFGGVTCLPGCFCMYRIKAPKSALQPSLLSGATSASVTSGVTSSFWVPILANPEIIDDYKEHIVDTLHKKNLLLLGEDRFLTTLMLRTFPKRKMIFVPQAICRTVVPSEFRVLLSQRRRWINSTVHNLMELLLVRDLCGIFCCSMQFVIFMELIGTVVLPAAVTFTGVLIVSAFFQPSQALIPLLLLGLVLGLPAILILLTTRKMVYVIWMLIYIAALPIWNFVLPVYAYWHFDDFSWGQTRKVEGELVSKGGHGDDIADRGAFMEEERTLNALKKIPLKRWSEWYKYDVGFRDEILKSSHYSPSELLNSVGPPVPEVPSITVNTTTPPQLPSEQSLSQEIHKTGSDSSTGLRLPPPRPLSNARLGNVSSSNSLHAIMPTAFSSSSFLHSPEPMTSRSNTVLSMTNSNLNLNMSSSSIPSISSTSGSSGSVNYQHHRLSYIHPPPHLSNSSNSNSSPSSSRTSLSLASSYASLLQKQLGRESK